MHPRGGRCAAATRTTWSELEDTSLDIQLFFGALMRTLEGLGHDALVRSRIAMATAKRDLTDLRREGSLW